VELVASEHKCRAEAILNRMVSGWTSGFLLLSFKTWSGLTQQQKLAAATIDHAEAADMEKKSVMLRRKQQAVCARVICLTESDTVALAFKAWEQAAINLNQCSAPETSESLLRVAEHVRRQRTREILMQVMMGWSMSTSSERADRSSEAKAQADFAKFDEILQALGEQMTLVSGNLSEACSELTASHSKCREIKQAIVESMELQAQLVNRWDVFEREWCGPKDDEFHSEFCQLKDDESDSELCPPKPMDEFDTEWWPAMAVA